MTRNSRRTQATAIHINVALLRRWQLPQVDGALGKKERGKILVVGGSDQIPGAVILAATGALRAGAGTLQIATSKTIAKTVAVAMPEARVFGLEVMRNGELKRDSCRSIHQHAEQCDALLIGPGMIDARAGTTLLTHCLKSKGTYPVIVDAAPLQAFATRLPKSGNNALVLTPHAGEMARMSATTIEAILERPIDAARQAAKQFNAVVVLKGATTYIAAPSGQVYCNTAGNTGLGTSGSGDTLCGIIAGLCARGADPLQAAVWGVFAHAKAGEALAQRIGSLGFLARELLIEIPGLLGRWTTTTTRRSQR